MGENGAWAYPGTAQIFSVPPIISGMGKATDFKFGRYFYRANPNKRTLKFLEKMEHGRIQGVPKFLGYPLLSLEWVKPRTSNLAGTFTGLIRIKPIKITEKMERGCIQGLPKFFGYPLLFQERVKLRTSNFEGTFIGCIRTKPREKCWEH